MQFPQVYYIKKVLSIFFDKKIISENYICYGNYLSRDFLIEKS